MTYKSSAITAELLALADENGLINPRGAVAWARKNRRSSLHAELEWDDAVAAEEYRVSQVRRLLAIHVVDDGGDRRLISLSIDRVAGGGYRQVADVARLPSLRAIMLEDAMTDLRRLEAKYQHLQELVSVWVATNEVERKTRGGTRRKRAA